MNSFKQSATSGATRHPPRMRYRREGVERRGEACYITHSVRVLWASHEYSKLARYQQNAVLTGLDRSGYLLNSTFNHRDLIATCKARSWNLNCLKVARYITTVGAHSARTCDDYAYNSARDINS